MRIILYTGKGGVGKTSIAAATACKLAAEGNKVLIMSTDQAHSLGDSLELKLGAEPVLAGKNLFAMEIDTVKESEAAWGSIQGYMKELLLTHADSGLEAEELLVFPGLEELFSLFKIVDIYKSKLYDILIIDCAPTGETLSLLKFPEQFGTLIENVMPMKRKMVKFAGPVIEKVARIPMPGEAVFDDINRLTNKLEEMERLMSCKDVVSIRIVTTPEKIVIQEAKRNYTCLHLYDYNVDAVIVNKVYPIKALEGYFNRWTVLQEEGLRMIRESFSGIPVFQLELQQRELKGISMLTNTGKALYGTNNPVDIFCADKFMSVSKTEGGYVMELKLPLANKEELELEEVSQELILRIRNETRRFSLPDTLRGKKVTKAKFENDILNVYFC